MPGRRPVLIPAQAWRKRRVVGGTPPLRTGRAFDAMRPDQALNCADAGLLTEPGAGLRAVPGGRRGGGLRLQYGVHQGSDSSWRRPHQQRTAAMQFQHRLTGSSPGVPPASTGDSGFAASADCPAVGTIRLHRESSSGAASTVRDADAAARIEQLARQRLRRRRGPAVPAVAGRSFSY